MRLDELIRNHTIQHGIPIAEILREAERQGIPPDQLPDYASVASLARPAGRGKNHLTESVRRRMVDALTAGLRIPRRSVVLAVGESMWGEGSMAGDPVDRLPPGWADLDDARFRLWCGLAEALIRDQRDAAAAAEATSAAVATRTAAAAELRQALDTLNP